MAREDVERQAVEAFRSLRPSTGPSDLCGARVGDTVIVSVGRTTDRHRPGTVEEISRVTTERREPTAWESIPAFIRGVAWLWAISTLAAFAYGIWAYNEQQHAARCAEYPALCAAGLEDKIQ